LKFTTLKKVAFKKKSPRVEQKYYAELIKGWLWIPVVIVFQNIYFHKQRELRHLWENKYYSISKEIQGFQQLLIYWKNIMKNIVSYISIFLNTQKTLSLKKKKVNFHSMLHTFTSILQKLIYLKERPRPFFSPVHREQLQLCNVSKRQSLSFYICL